MKRVQSNLNGVLHLRSLQSLRSSPRRPSLVSLPLLGPSLPFEQVSSLDPGFFLTSIADPTPSPAIRLLSSKSHLDTTLLTTSYTLRLLHSLLPRLGPPFPPTALSARLRSSLHPLAAVIDDYRTLLRLTSLLSILSGLLAHLHSPPTNPLLRALTAAQIISIGAFQALENGAYLAGRGVLAWSEAKKARAWRWSARCWMVYTGLAIARLGLELRLRSERKREQLLLQEMQEKEKAELGEKEVGEVVEAGEKSGVGAVIEAETEESALVQKQKEQQEEEEKQQEIKWWADWKRSMGVNLAYAPMCVHYSFGDGFLGEGSMAALGCVVAWLSIGEAWRATA